MKIRKLIAWLLVVVLCFSLTACSNDSQNNNTSRTQKPVENNTVSNDESAIESNSPLLYKVTDSSGNVVWLFGSIHIGREEYYPLPDYVLNVFDSCDTLAVEDDIIAYEIDYQQQIKDMQLFLYDDGSKISDHIPEELYTKAAGILKKYKKYQAQYNYFNTIFWFSLIENVLFEEVGANFDLGIDRHLINRAYDKNIEVYEIESSEFQYSMLTNYSEELQIYLLEQIVNDSENTDEIKNSIETMLDMWAEGDEEKFAEYLHEDTSEFSEYELSLYNEYNDAMIVNRNINMTNYAETALKSGKDTFICVGSAHVVGDGAIADLMKERGYTVEIIKE